MLLKHLDWKYEQELRLISESFTKNQCFIFSPYNLKSVPFGLNCKPDEDLINLLRLDKFSHVKLYRNPGYMGLEREEINL